MKRRLAFSAACASAVAIALVVTAAYCFPLCSLYTDSNPEWYIFQCWSCEGR